MAQEHSVPTEPQSAREPNDASSTCRTSSPAGPGNADALPGQLLGIPIWDGSDPAGRTILVHCEPRLDDCVKYARYLPLLSGRRASVLIACPPPLLRLFGRMPGVRAIADGDVPPPVDAQVVIGRLPVLFDTTLATIPTFASYLRPAAPLVEVWHQRLRQRDRGPGGAGRALKVGFAWTGNCDGAIVGPLTLLPGAAALQWVSMEAAPSTFQKGVRRLGFDLRDVALQIFDLADTAAVIAQLDLVIASGDSVAAHVAGALGKPVWTFVSASAASRWSPAGRHAPWYPSMRLFRQGADGDWSDALDAAARALRESASSGNVLAA